MDWFNWIGCQVTDYWWLTKDGDRDCLDLFERHYSRYRYKDGRQPKLFCGPGEKMVLRSDPLIGFCIYLLVYRSFVSADGQQGVNVAIFRNEAPDFVQSSELLLNAEEFLLMAWPWATRLYTYVNPAAVRSRNPGYCFKAAGWQSCGRTKTRNLIILEKNFLST